MYLKKITLAFTFFMSVVSLAQTNHTISTSGMSWSPSELTVEIGDTVTFINTGGNHNVNGTQSTFPNNPESFGNSVSSGWTFQHIFSSGGEYNFQCDPHANGGMTGKIIVQNELFAQNLNNENFLSLFPNPFQNSLNIQNCEGGQVFFYSIVGKLEINQTILSSNYILNTEELPAGVYLYKVIKPNNETFSGKLVKK